MIFNNSATHGGAIFTDSNMEMTIEDSVFLNNAGLTTLDYCMIKRSETTDHETYRYKYSSCCDEVPGFGGVIFAKNSINIKNSLFENNTARSGGAIASPSIIVDKYRSSRQMVDYSLISNDAIKDPYASDYNLNIENSIFRNNEAKDTRCGNMSLLVTGIYDAKYYQNCHGGAIFGSYNEFNLFDSLFEFNSASDGGGALCVQVGNSSVEGCKFYNNTAGVNGGAMDILGDFQMVNTEMSDNKAKIGGAMQYNHYTYYGRVQDNLNGFNLTVSNNKALERGGAFVISGTTTITHSNIYGNFAPEGSTISGIYGDVTSSKIDMRSNWWGTTKGPDASVWKQENIRFRVWANDKVKWDAISISPSDYDDDGNKGNGNNGKSYANVVDISTGSSVHTGSTLTVDTSSGRGSHGFNFNGNWPNGNGSGNGNSGGNFDYGDGASPFNMSGRSRTDVSGNAVNPNSMSKVNSSAVNDLASVGMTANAADSSSSSPSSASEGENGGSNKAYEITNKVKKEIIDDEDLAMFNVLFILLWIFLFIGFYRKYRDKENNV